MACELELCADLGDPTLTEIERGGLMRTGSSYEVQLCEDVMRTR
jgi:hypothetical protein